MVRSVIAVLAGLVVMVVLVVVFTIVGVMLFYPGQQPGAAVTPTTPWLVANLGYSLLAAVAGGWTAARIARRKRMAHAVVLAVIALALAVPGLLTETPEGQPAWYAGVIAAVGILGVLAGGRLAAARTPHETAEVH